MTVEITLTHVISTVGAILALYSVLYSRFGVKLQLMERIAAIEVKVAIWMKLLEAQLPHLGLLVKQPHERHERMDFLIDKFVRRGTSVKELYELRGLLQAHIEEIMADYEQEKQEAVRRGLALPNGTHLIATSTLYAAVGAQVEEYEYKVREAEARKHWPWLRRFFNV